METSNIFKKLDKDSIITGLKGKNKKIILAEMIEHLAAKRKIDKNCKKEVLKVLIQREAMGSTAIGGFIALPHARVDCVDNIAICFAVSSEGINFDSLDQAPVHIVVLLLSNQKEAGLHLKMLAFLARMLRDKYFVQQIKAAKNPQDVLALVRKQEQILR